MCSTFKPNYTCELNSKKNTYPILSAHNDRQHYLGSTKTYAQRFTLRPYHAQSEMLMLPQRQQYLQTCLIYYCGLTT